MSLLEVRFIGSFFLHYDEETKNATVYLRASDCRGFGPHVPKLAFSLSQDASSDFAPGDELHLSLSGEKIVSRRIPENLELSFGTLPQTGIELEVTRRPSSIDDHGLSVSLLPDLKDGGATNLQRPENLKRLSSTVVRLGSAGKLTCEKVVRDSNGEPITWEFRNASGESKAKQMIAEVLTWTVDLGTDEVTIMAKDDKDSGPLLELSNTKNTKFEILISNLSEAPIKTNAKDPLEDFVCLLDYSDSRSEIRIPHLPDESSTGGSVICPGARWP